MSIILDGTTGITTPGLTNTGTETILNLTTTGNTILGDATTDTLNVGAGGLVKDASGNVGIGTASPNAAAKLTLYGSAANLYTGLLFIDDSTSYATGVGGRIGFSGKYTSGGGSAAWAALAGLKENATDGNYAGFLQFSTRPNGGAMAEQMRLDSSGNLGLGVTPSAWGLGKAIEVGYSGNSLWGVQSSGDVRLGANFYYNGANYIYSTTNAAGYYRIAQGIHYWNTAPSGTAGTGITFTQAMILDASGNLAIGRTSASYRLHIATTATNGTAVTGLSITNDASNSGVGAKINLGAGNGFDSTSSGVSGFYDGTGTALAFLTSSSYGVSNHTERMRIDSSGLVGIGLTPTNNNNPLQVAKSAVGNPVYVSIKNSDSSSDYSHAGIYLQAKNGAAYAVAFADKANALLRLGYNTEGSTLGIDGSGNIGSFGGQITFPASQSASSNANTLDDYEEGTFTVTFTAAAGGQPTVSYNYNGGRYIKVGKLVYYTLRLGVASVSGGTSSLCLVSGLPFTAVNSANSYPGALANYKSAWATLSPTYGRILANATDIELYASATTGESNIQTNYLASGCNLILTGCYEASA